MLPPVFPKDDALIAQLLKWAHQRICTEAEVNYDAAAVQDLEHALGGKITAAGLGAKECFDLYTQVVAAGVRTQDSALNVSYVPAAPTPLSLALDAALSASQIFAGTWEAGSAAIHAENKALEWLASVAGFPSSSGGVFVAGGTMGNLSALHAARFHKRKQVGDGRRLALLCSAEAHSSVLSNARILDVGVVQVPVDDCGRMDTRYLSEVDTSNLFAVVANAGATNCGAVDDMQALAQFARQHDLWLHVDGAYGAAALASPAARHIFAGIEHADSLVVDPHKWLFAPYDCCALLYRNPARAAQAHTQHAVYLDPIRGGAWNPADYAAHLSRRARGLPFWFSLVYYGTDRFGEGIARCIATTKQLAKWIASQAELELLLCSELSVLLFRPRNMSDDALAAWSERNKREGTILCMPTSWRGRRALRVCIVNPETRVADLTRHLASLTVG